MTSMPSSSTTTRRRRGPSERRWVRGVMTDSTHPPPGTFSGSAAKIARTMARKDVSPRGLGSGIRMIQYFINRGGNKLSARRRFELERAKPDSSAPSCSTEGSDQEAVKNDIDLSRTTVLITGSTDGVGRLVATRAASAGAPVLVHGRRDAKGHATLDMIQREAPERECSTIAPISRDSTM